MPGKLGKHQSTFKIFIIESSNFVVSDRDLDTDNIIFCERKKKTIYKKQHKRYIKKDLMKDK